jgi:hypothetical protein
MIWVEMMFRIVGSLVLVFVIVFTIFLRVHGNPMRELAKWTHGNVSDIKDVVIKIHSNMSK